MVLTHSDTTGYDEDPLMENLIRDELTRVRADRKTLFSLQEHRIIQTSFIICCFLVNTGFYFYRPDYIALFIAASFYLNMFYFVSLLLPTSSGKPEIPRPDISRSLNWFKEVGLIPGTSRFTRLLMNSFFLNSRALSGGIGLLFVIDILYSLIAYSTGGLSFNTIIIVLSQAAVILVFYSLVWRIEPFSTRYAKNVRSMRERLSREKIPGWVISVLFYSGFVLSFVVFMTAIILLPGITAGMFLSQSGLSQIGYLVALLAVLGSSQYFVVRWIHGISSRNLAMRLFEQKETSLLQVLETGTAGNTEFGSQIETTIVLLESKIYQIRRNSFFGLFPVFVVDLDFSVLLDSSALTAITGYIRETG